ncbi:DsbA family protein [Paraflavitalea speifideaquila]|uniref:DsbA family protein n=1 Tax=Paraflavitalea speifideaquila TaxID=3076558 RepID=UPI0028E4FD2D|nr:thioredoxin domain-containing protein [Paraflavitalea speifideiaquila]
MASKLQPPLNQTDHVLGVHHAEIELIEFGDYQCPHCGAAWPVVKQLQKTYVKNMLFAFRHFPLSNAHEYAFAAAMAAEAAARQQRFWEMHDLIFENQALLSEQLFPELAQALSLNMAAFGRDLSVEALREKVEADFESGIRSGVNGTPTFYMNGLKYTGSYDYDTMAVAIEQHLTETRYQQ